MPQGTQDLSFLARIEPMPHVVEPQGPNHYTVREDPNFFFKCFYLNEVGDHTSVFSEAPSTMVT